MAHKNYSFDGPLKSEATQLEQTPIENVNGKVRFKEVYEVWVDEEVLKQDDLAHANRLAALQAPVDNSAEIAELEAKRAAVAAFIS